MNPLTTTLQYYTRMRCTPQRRSPMQPALQQTRASDRLLVLCNTFPKLSETFVLGETLALQAAGFNVYVAAFQPPAVADRAPSGATVAPLHSQQRQLQRAPVYFQHNIRLTLALLPRVVWLCSQLPRLLRGDGRMAHPRELWQALWLAAYCMRHRIQHVHAHYLSAPARVAALFNRLTGKPFSISAHAKDIYLGDPAQLRALMAQASFTATCTAHNEHYLQEVAGAVTAGAHGDALAPPIAAAPARIARVYHGVDTEQFAPLPSAATTRQTLPLILSVGRFRDKKGFDLLIRACAQLRQYGHAFQCQIVGYGPEHAFLDQLIKTFALDPQVQLLPPEPHQVLVKRFAASNIFALPCRVSANGDRDGIPNVVLEAMAMALPVVSTSVSGVPEVIEHGHSGLLVPANSVSALADALAELLHNPGLAQRLGEHARQCVLERFGWQRAAAELTALIHGSARQQPHAAQHASNQPPTHALEQDTYR